jgi:phosphoserine phosphatase
MSVKTIYIVRHGETEQNRLGIVQGRGIDSSLNETGRIQSESFYTYYKSISFCRLYCSSQKRSFETIQHFIHHTPKIIRDERLDEICWGEHEGKAGEELLMKKYDRIISSWSEGNYHDKPEGGESAYELYTRVKSFLQELENETFQKALICTHGRTLRAMICLLQNKPLKYMEHIRHHNTGLYQATYDRGSWNIIKENDCLHLQQNSTF